MMLLMMVYVLTGGRASQTTSRNCGQFDLLLLLLQSYTYALILTVMSPYVFRRKRIKTIERREVSKLQFTNYDNLPTLNMLKITWHRLRGFT